MRTKYENVKTIPKCFVGEDHAQVLFWFTDNITLINTDFNDEKILCHYDFDSDSQNINKYLTDERRKAFAYHNIPMYQAHLGYSIRYYLNQILEFNKHYLLVGYGSVQDVYLVKDGNNAKKLARGIEIPSKVKEEVLSKYEIFKRYKDKVLMTIDNEGHHLDFESEFDYLMDSYGGLLIIKEDSETTIPNKKENIKFIMIKIHQAGYGEKYSLGEYTIPFNHYTLEELKYMSPKIEEVEEPRINLRENPNISRDEIKKAKRLARKLNRNK